jgi:hypothetical protein
MMAASSLIPDFPVLFIGAVAVQGWLTHDHVMGELRNFRVEGNRSRVNMALKWSVALIEVVALYFLHPGNPFTFFRGFGAGLAAALLLGVYLDLYVDATRRAINFEAKNDQEGFILTLRQSCRACGTCDFYFWCAMLVAMIVQ